MNGARSCSPFLSLGFFSESILCDPRGAGGMLLPCRARYHIGLGTAQVARGAMFGGRKGVGVLMTRRVFSMPSCNGAARLRPR